MLIISTFKRQLFFLLFYLPFICLSQTVNTAYGPVTGQKNGSVYEFLGVPFASPPTDSLRWRPPLPPEPWSMPLHVQSFPPKCPQRSSTQWDTTYTIEGDEDCLYLNIWTPDTAGSFPVMVFIHGGGHQAGSASEVSGGAYIYYGKHLAKRGEVVVVTIQYRLGALGFLAHAGLEQESPHGISGNYGVMDQIFALEWIQNNIGAFGGNPSNVTIFGESAGGTSVGNMLLTPLASNLFHKAIIQSASPRLMPYNEALLTGTDFVDLFTTTGSPLDKIAFMRQVPADSISEKLESPLLGGVVQPQWRPVLDNFYFTEKPIAAFESGNYNKVPLIIGSNADEMSLSAPSTVTPAMVTSLVSNAVPPLMQPMILAEYPPGNTNEEARESYIGILTDAQFTSPARRIAGCISLNQHEDVWRYFFTFSHTLPALQPYGAYHGIELFYVFNTWENTNLGSGILFKPEDDSVQTAILSYWTQFAYTGNPNTTGLPQWPVYESTTDCYLEIKATPDGSKCGVRTQKCDIWDAVVGFTGCSSSLQVKRDILENNEWLLFPNPVKDFFILNIDGLRETVMLSVYDSKGAMVFRKNVRSNDVINVTHLNAGFYFFQINSEKIFKSGKFIKH